MAFECSQLAGRSAFPGSGDALINSTKAQMKERLREKVLALWNDECFYSDTGEMTRAFSPTIEAAEVIRKRRLPFYVTQILTGHSFLNQHHYRFKFATTPSCACGHQIESVEHFLFEWNKFSSIREQFQAICLGGCDERPPPLAYTLPTGGQEPHGPAHFPNPDYSLALSSLAAVVAARSHRRWFKYSLSQPELNFLIFNLTTSALAYVTFGGSSIVSRVIIPKIKGDPIIAIEIRPSSSASGTLFVS